MARCWLAMNLATAARLSPLQSSVLHVLRDGKRREPQQVFHEIEALSPPTLDRATASAFYIAVCGALEHLVAAGFVEHRGRMGYVLSAGPRPTASPTTAPVAAKAAATRNAVS